MQVHVQGKTSSFEISKPLDAEQAVPMEATSAKIMYPFWIAQNSEKTSPSLALQLESVEFQVPLQSFSCKEPCLRGTKGTRHFVSIYVPVLVNHEEILPGTKVFAA